MIIGGLQKFSLLDYPGHVSAIVFTAGCNFRCQFCYNPELIRAPEEKFPSASSCDAKAQKGYPLINKDDLFEFLDSRVGKLDAIVISGGEPTLHKDLPEFIRDIRSRKFKIKLDTNGTRPEVIADLLKNKSLDYIAMDLKGALENYNSITNAQTQIDKIKDSINTIMQSGVPYEFRTTVVPELIVLNDIDKMGKLIKGAEKWFLQKFKSDISLVNANFEGRKPFQEKEMQEMLSKAKKYVKICDIR